MKRTLLNILLLFCSVTSFAEDNTWLRIQLSNGGTVSYLVAGKLKMSFDEKEIIISSPRLSSSFRRDAISSYSFEGALKDVGIRQTTLPDCEVTHLSKDIIGITGIAPEQDLKVYASNGTQQSPTVRRTADGVTIDFSNLPAGVFIITLPGTNIPAIKLTH